MPRLQLRIPAALALVCALAIWLGPQVALAQALPGISLPSPTVQALSPGVRREGTFLTAPVMFEGAPIFRLATPLNAAPGHLPVDVRAEYVGAVLGQLLAVVSVHGENQTVYDPQSFHVSVAHSNGEVLLTASDAKHAPVSIVTITQADAKYQGVGIDALAKQWSASLQQTLVAALTKRQPAQVRKNFGSAGRMVAFMLVVTSAALFLIALLRRRRIARVEAIGGLLVWAVFIAWFAAITWALFLFPLTTPIGHAIVRTILHVVLVVGIAAIVNGLANVAISQTARALRAVSAETNAEDSRRALRVPTIARALTGLKTFLVIFIAALALLSMLGIPIGSVITIGGLAALAVSFAAQNLVRDVLNGFLVLLEDQYVVGDYICVDANAGLVEHLSLRIVQIRDAEGSLITIPHSSATTVVNQSRNWSRVDFRVPVDVGANVLQAIDLLDATIEGISQEKQWRGAILDKPEFIGIERIARGGIVLRASIRTAPLRQFELKRELNARVLAAFAAANVPLAHDPATMVVGS